METNEKKIKAEDVQSLQDAHSYLEERCKEEIIYEKQRKLAVRIGILVGVLCSVGIMIYQRYIFLTFYVPCYSQSVDISLLIIEIVLLLVILFMFSGFFMLIVILSIRTYPQMCKLSVSVNEIQAKRAEELSEIRKSVENNVQEQVFYLERDQKEMERFLHNKTIYEERKEKSSQALEVWRQVN